jgi:hypothetical protein
LSENILLVTFNTDPWHISASFEILAKEIKNKNNVEWLILDKPSLGSQELPISSKLRLAEIRKKLDKILLENIGIITPYQRHIRYLKEIFYKKY